MSCSLGTYVCKWISVVVQCGCLPTQLVSPLPSRVLPHVSDTIVIVVLLQSLQYPLCRYRSGVLALSPRGSGMIERLAQDPDTI